MTPTQGWTNLALKPQAIPPQVTQFATTIRSTTLDKPLDDTISLQPKGHRHSHHGECIANGPTKTAGAAHAACARYVDGVPANCAVMVAPVPTVQPNATKSIVSDLPTDINESQIRELFIPTVKHLREVNPHYDAKGNLKVSASTAHSKWVNLPTTPKLHWTDVALHGEASYLSRAQCSFVQRQQLSPKTTHAILISIYMMPPLTLPFSVVMSLTRSECQHWDLKQCGRAFSQAPLPAQQSHVTALVSIVPWTWVSNIARDSIPKPPAPHKIAMSTTALFLNTVNQRGMPMPVVGRKFV